MAGPRHKRGGRRGVGPSHGVAGPNLVQARRAWPVTGALGPRPAGQGKCAGLPAVARVPCSDKAHEACGLSDLMSEQHQRQSARSGGPSSADPRDHRLGADVAPWTC